MYLYGFFFTTISLFRPLYLVEWSFLDKISSKLELGCWRALRFKRKIVGNCFTGKSVPSLIKSDQVTEKSSAREEKCCKYRSCSREIICKNVHYNSICLLYDTGGFCYCSDSDNTDTTSNFFSFVAKMKKTLTKKNTIFDDAPITGNSCIRLHC